MSKTAAPASGWLSVILIIAGILAAGSADDEGGRVVLGALLGIALALLYRVRHRVRDLESRLQALEQQATHAATEAEPAVAAATTRAAGPPPLSQTVAPTAAVLAGPEPVAAMPPPRAAPADGPTPPPLPSAVEPGWTDRAYAAALAWLKRGNPIARAGVVTLFFGGSFLAKYAAEHSMFPIELRMAALGAGALLLLGLGWRLRGKQALYAQTLQGGGVAGFYLTVFAATRLYHLLPQPMALGLMVVVALAAAVLAVAQNALALAVIGTGGGFLAPILLSTGGGSLAALFTYYTVLNLGVFTVAWFRAWRVLNLVGFVFTFGVAGLFRATAYTAPQQATMDFFLWLFFLLYVAVSVLFSLRQKPDLKGYVSGSLVFGLPLAAFTLHTSVIAHDGLALAWSALGLAVFYLVLAAALWRARIENLRLLVEAFAALGVIFATLAVPLGFDRHTTATAWAVEGAGLVWLGTRQQRRLARAFGLLLQLAAGVGHLLSRGDYEPAHAVLNGLFLGSAALAVSGLLSGWWLFRNRPASAPHEAYWDSIVMLWGVAWWLIGGLAEIHNYAAAVEAGADLGLAAFTIAALCALAGRLLWPLLLRVAAVLLPLSALLALAAAQRFGHPLIQGAWLGWPLLLAAGWWLLWRLESAADEVLREALPGLHAGSVWLLALLAAWELSWYAGTEIGGVWRYLPWGVAPALLLGLLSRDRLTPAWPLARHEETYRQLAAIPLGLFIALWAVLINLLSDGDPRELSYLPLLNPLDLSVLLGLITLGRHWSSLGPQRRARFTPDDPRILPAAAAAVVFLWLNAALIRALHYAAGTPLDVEGVFRSITVQAALSIFWGVLAFAAMTVAARRSQRALWLAGAGLMAVLLLKLFLVDTAGRGTLARIVSFLIVGALLLVTGYVSPLPPHKPAGTQPDSEPDPEPEP